MRGLSHRSLFALACACLLQSACVPLPGNIDLKQHDYDSMAVPICKPANEGKVFFRGRSHDLGACLRSVAGSRIRELRIDSAGGEADRTLAAMSQFLGKIDLLIIDGVCGSSCANYVVPVAEALLVKPNSYILLHGSIEVSHIRSSLKAQRADLAQRYPEIPSAELDRLLEAAAEAYSAPEKSQAEFEQKRLSCSDWLRPSNTIKARYAAAPPATRPGEPHWLLVTPRMADRCLKQTRIRSFWAVPEGRMPAQLTAIGAVRAD